MNKEEAEKAGEELLKLLPGWRLDIWENLGWHYSARDPEERMAIRDNGFGSGKFGRFRYTCYLNFPGKLPGGLYAESGATPQEAIRATIQAAQTEKDQIDRLIAGLVVP